MEVKFLEGRCNNIYHPWFFHNNQFNNGLKAGTQKNVLIMITWIQLFTCLINNYCQNLNSPTKDFYKILSSCSHDPFKSVSILFSSILIAWCFSSNISHNLIICFLALDSRITKDQAWKPWKIFLSRWTTNQIDQNKASKIFPSISLFLYNCHFYKKHFFSIGQNVHCSRPSNNDGIRICRIVWWWLSVTDLSPIIKV